MTHSDRYISVADVAERIGVHAESVRRMIRNGDIAPALRVQNEFRVPESALASWIERHTVTVTPDSPRTATGAALA